jgi:hypothetical protein
MLFSYIMFLAITCVMCIVAPYSLFYSIINKELIIYDNYVIYY